MARTHPLLKKRGLAARATSSCLPSSSLLEKWRRCGHGHSISLQEGSRGGMANASTHAFLKSGSPVAILSLPIPCSTSEVRRKRRWPQPHPFLKKREVTTMVTPSTLASGRGVARRWPNSPTSQEKESRSHGHTLPPSEQRRIATLATPSQVGPTITTPFFVLEVGWRGYGHTPPNAQEGEGQRH